MCDCVQHLLFISLKAIGNCMNEPRNLKSIFRNSLRLLKKKKKKSQKWFSNDMSSFYEIVTYFSKQQILSIIDTSFDNQLLRKKKKNVKCRTLLLSILRDKRSLKIISWLMGLVTYWGYVSLTVGLTIRVAQYPTK